MKTKLTVMLMGILALASVAGAQTTGTITVSGTNPAACSITDATNGTVSATIALGNLDPATGGSLTAGTTSVRLRSNKAYTLSAQATSLSFLDLGSTDGGTTIAATDIGFGITAAALSGANVANDGSRTDAVVSKFDYIAGGWPSVSNGLTPSFTGTLNDISGAGAQILSGGRISTKGNISTNNNFILITLGVATLPQYFTPNTSFSSTITLTLATP